MTIDELLASSNWAEVFCESNSGGGVSDVVETCPPGAVVDLTLPKRADVVEIIAASEDLPASYDFNLWSGVGVFKLRDGRYLAASGWCDTTGWGCRAGNSLEVGHTLADVVTFGLSEDDRAKLGLGGDTNPQPA